MDVVYFSIIPTFEPSRYCKCWIVCFYYTKLMMVNANLGFGLVPAFVRLVRYEKIKMKEFAPPYISRCFYALCHKENQNGHVREFFEDYVKYAQEERD